MSEKKEIIIEPSSKFFDFDLKEVWEYRDLVTSFVSRNFKLIYKQTILGPIWLVLNPILTSIIFTFIFGQFAGLSTDGVPQFLFYMSGTTLWNLFSTNCNNNSNIFMGNAAIYRKIYFPRLAIPISQSISAVVNFMIQFSALMLIFIRYVVTGSGIYFSFKMLLVIVFVFHAIILSLAVGLISSCLTSKYRDFAFMFTLGMQLWMYVTPVVYPMSYTGGYMYKILLLNPMTAIMNNFKWAFLGSGNFMMGDWIYSIVFTVVMLFIGLGWFNKVEKTFVDVV